MCQLQGVIILQLGLLFLLILLLAYEKIRRPMVCEEKICQYIESLNGRVMNIKKPIHREELYIVEYKVNGNVKQSTVKFNLFYKQKWY